METGSRSYKTANLVGRSSVRRSFLESSPQQGPGWQPPLLYEIVKEVRQVELKNFGQPQA